MNIMKIKVFYLIFNILIMNSFTDITKEFKFDEKINIKYPKN